MSVENQAGSDAAPLESVVQTETQNEIPQEGGADRQEKQKTGNPKIDDPWPESARNKVSRLEKQLAERKARERDLARRMADYEAAQEKAAKDAGRPKEPDENDFDNYGEYLKAVARFRPQQDNQQQQVDPKTIHEQALQQARVQMHYEQRKAVVMPQIDKAMAEYPELAQLEDQYADVIESAPEPVLLAFLDADNPAAAFYALAKEGKLEQLAFMPPTRMAFEIAQAQMRGEQMMKSSKVSKAPQPIQGVRGASSGGRDPETMSGKELRKKYGV